MYNYVEIHYKLKCISNIPMLLSKLISLIFEFDKLFSSLIIPLVISFNSFLNPLDT